MSTGGTTSHDCWDIVYYLSMAQIGHDTTERSLYQFSAAV